MDPLSEIEAFHQDHNQDPTMLAFSPLFTPPGFAFDDPAANYLPIFQELDDSFSFPINCPPNQEQYLPNSNANFDPFYGPWINFDHAVEPAVLPQAAAAPEMWSMGGSQLQLGPPASSSGRGHGQQLAPEENDKKKHHNASERMRRLRLNRLFATLGSVVPGTDQKKKQTAPSTVDRVIKYIPELQKEVEMLTQRKEQLLPLTSNSPNASLNDVVFPQFAPTSNSSITTIVAPPPPPPTTTSSWSVEATKLGNGEISIHISTPKSLINTFVPISEVIRMLEEELEEEERLIIIDVSSSDSSAGRVFYHIHLEEERTLEVDLELLRMKLLSSCQKWEDMCLWMITQGM